MIDIITSLPGMFNSLTVLILWILLINVIK